MEVGQKVKIKGDKYICLLRRPPQPKRQRGYNRRDWQRVKGQTPNAGAANRS
jgi:Ni/Co efflux regulator RcnB